MRLSLIALVTDPLTLKRRFLEENCGLGNFKFSGTVISSQHFELDQLLPFVNKLPAQTNLSTVRVSGETLST